VSPAKFPVAKFARLTGAAGPTTIPNAPPGNIAKRAFANQAGAVLPKLAPHWAIMNADRGATGAERRSVVARAPAAKPATRAEILQKIAEVKKLLIQLIIQLIAELQKQLAALPKTN
jgi:hypothetical protein